MRYPKTEYHQAKATMVEVGDDTVDKWFWLPATKECHKEKAEKELTFSRHSVCWDKEWASSQWFKVRQLTNKWWHGARLYSLLLEITTPFCITPNRPPGLAVMLAPFPSPESPIHPLLLSFPTSWVALRRNEGSMWMESMHIEQSPKDFSGASGSGSGIGGW